MTNILQQKHYKSKRFSMSVAVCFIILACACLICWCFLCCLFPPIFRLKFTRNIFHINMFYYIFYANVVKCCALDLGVRSIAHNRSILVFCLFFFVSLAGGTKEQRNDSKLIYTQCARTHTFRLRPSKERKNQLHNVRAQCERVKRAIRNRDYRNLNLI